MKIISRNFSSLAAMAALLASSTAFAGSSGKEIAATTPPPPPPSPWEFTVSSGLSLAGGNSHTLQLDARALVSYLDPKNELYLGADYLYGHDRASTTTDSLRIYETYNRLLTDRFYIGLNTEYYRDDIADLDHRVTVLPKLGYYLFKNDTASLAIETGGGYVWERKGGAKTDHAALLFGETFKLKLTAASSFFETVAFVPEAGDFDNYVLQADVGISTRLSSRLSWNVGVRDIYDSRPAAGRESNDLSLLTSLSFALGGIPEPAPAPPRRSLMPDVPKPATPGKGWDTTAGVGFGLTRGNSETLAASVNLNTAYRDTAHEFFFDALAAYGETGSETTVQSVRAAVQFNQILADPFYIGERVGFLHDQIAEVDYRVTPAFVGGVYLVKTDATKLSFEAGPAYTFERLGGNDDNYFTVLAGQKLDWKLNDTVSLKQFVTGTLDTSNTDKWVLSAGATLNIVLTGKLMLQTSVIASYDNLPAPGVQHSDLLLTSGFAFRF